MTKRQARAAAKAKTPNRGPKRQQGEARTRRGGEPQTKTASLLAILARPNGASVAEMQTLTGWQPHSVRGFLAGTVKKMPGLTLSSEKAGEESRRYRVQRAPA